MALTASFAVSVGVFNTTYAAQARVDAAAHERCRRLGDDRGIGRAAPGVARPPWRGCPAWRPSSRCSTGSPTSGTISRTSTASTRHDRAGHIDVGRVLRGGRRGHDVSATLAATPERGARLGGDRARLPARSSATAEPPPAAPRRTSATTPWPSLRRGRARVPDRASSDSFLVANAAYVAQATHSRSPRRRCSCGPTARRRPSPGQIRTVLGPTSGATVQDIVTQQHDHLVQPDRDRPVGPHAP